MAVRLFVGNLSYTATEADLRELFAPVGEPSKIVIPTDRDTGRPRGFAFVEFLDRGVAEEVIRRFNAQSVKGRPIAVSEARPREERAGPLMRPSGPGRTGPVGPPEGPPGAATRPRPAREFGPPARRQRAEPRRGQKQENAGPKGPIRERRSGRFFDVDDQEDVVAEEPEDFDDFARSTKADDEKKEEEEES
ncbi:MAG: hypothetical protein HYX76_05965 [Acidobacteria bacterium]|nr:hypothetical protein [Acidobacteriota bacterium]